MGGGCYTVLASKDLDIGGEQVTDVLVQYLGNEFKQKYKEDILKNKRGRAKLAAQAETVKHVLSTLDTAHCYVESLYDGMDFSSNVTRARFDSLVSTLIQELLSKVLLHRLATLSQLKDWGGGHLACWLSAKTSRQ